MVSYTVLFICVAVVAASNDCSDGSAYWCQNVRNAKTCGAFDYCLSNVWNSNNIQTPGCETGESIVRLIQSHTHDSDPCIELLGEPHKRCQSVKAEHSEEFLKLSQTGLRPSAIAKLLDICTSNYGVMESDLCADCKKFLADVVASLIGPDIESHAADMMKQMCSEFPSQLSGFCETVTLDWIQHLFVYLNEQARVDDICKAMTLCTQETVHREYKVDLHTVAKLVRVAFMGVSSDASCNTCKLVLQDFRNMVEDKEFQSGVEEMMVESVCQIFPNQTANVCKGYLQDFTKMFFNVIAAQIEPEVLCEAMAMCPTKHNLMRAVSSGLHTTVTMVIPAATMAAEQLQPLLQRVSFSKLSSTTCTICEMMAKEVKSHLESTTSQDKLLVKMEKYCDYLPDPLNAQCVSFLDDNGKTIIEMVLNSVSPKMICQAVGMCEQTKEDPTGAATPVFGTTQLLMALLHKNEDPTVKPADITPPKNPDGHDPERAPLTPWCKICQDIAEVADNFVGSKELETIVIGLGEGACDMFIGQLKTKCQTMVREEVDKMLGQMDALLVPQFVCGVVGVCQQHLTPMHYNVKPLIDPSDL